jgi:hypothetical protein
VLSRIFNIWKHASDPETREIASWSLANQYLVPRDGGVQCGSIEPSDVEQLLQNFDDFVEDDEREEKTAALVVAWYTRTRSDAEIAKAIQELDAEQDNSSRYVDVRQMLFEVCTKGTEGPTDFTVRVKKRGKGWEANVADWQS